MPRRIWGEGDTVRRVVVVGCALAIACLSSALSSVACASGDDDLHARIDRGAVQVEPNVVAWRRDIHAHPELSNREFRTSDLVAKHLASLRIGVQRGVAHTGVVGLSLARVYGAEHVRETQPITAAEDFSFYQEKVPGLFFFVGVRDSAVPAAQAVPNHSPRFDAVNARSRSRCERWRRSPSIF